MQLEQCPLGSCSVKITRRILRHIPAGNSLVIACTAAIFAEIETTVRQLDGLMPPAGHSIFIIQLENVSPDAAKSVIETIGLDKPQPADGRDPVYAGQISSIQLGRRVLIPQPTWRQQTQPPAAPAVQEGE